MVCQHNLIKSTNYKGTDLKLSNDILPIITKLHSPTEKLPNDSRKELSLNYFLT
jgi:hypothetical protein